MSCQHYNKQMQNLKNQYASYPDELGMIHYGDTYDMTPMNPQMTTMTARQAAQQHLYLQANPTANLYRTFGPGGLEMQASGSSDCDKGCVGLKSNPQNPRVKPLYQHNYYQLPKGTPNVVHQNYHSMY